MLVQILVDIFTVLQLDIFAVLQPLYRSIKSVYLASMSSFSSFMSANSCAENCWILTASSLIVAAACWRSSSVGKARFSISLWNNSVNRRLYSGSASLFPRALLEEPAPLEASLAIVSCSFVVFVRRLEMYPTSSGIVGWRCFQPVQVSSDGDVSNPVQVSYRSVGDLERQESIF